MISLVIPALVSCIVAFLVVYALTPPLTRYLEKKGMVVRDVIKKDAMVARPGGISIVAGMIASEAALYAFLQLDAILAVMATTGAAFVVGYVDDRKTMGGWFKPILLAVSAAPIILLGTYDTNLAFPLFGEVRIPILYLGIIPIMIAVTGNTINSIDIMNGVASGFMVIAGFSLSLCLFILQNFEMALVSLPLGFVALAFYKYHKIPSSIFPGDSGALAFGAMYGAIAIVGEVEVIAAMALLPAIFNSFLFLSSVKRIAEHRDVSGKEVEVTDELLLRNTDIKTAPRSLMRIILTWGPLSERQAAMVIFKLAAFSGGLAVFTALLAGVFA